MRRFLSTLVTLLWALWFGGVVMLFIAVLSLFAAFPEHHDIAGQGAARIFHVFNAYQLALAGLTLVATFVWYLKGPPGMKMGLFLLFALATAAAGLITLYIAPEIAQMQAKQLSQSAEFKRMHGYSMIAYVAEAVVLLIAGLLLPWMRE
ncbi:MAG TPA: DUF4149 domain-containing protein [Tepidisphaeraceae bacterium]|jgi:hypothetical protein|nr:DUF4149 domain-containing protein [Tepidisphaeraceae bacterium]